MKNKYCLNLIHSPLLAIALATGAATAGVTETTTSAPMAPVAEDVVSGIFKLDFNSHFISYGNDVWGDGSSLSDPTFNPMIELAIALPADLTLTVGAWFDINDKIDSAIGGRIQEVDVWTGLSYTYDKFTVGVTYQQWNYASETEEILDVKFAYDTFLSPSLTFHNRLDAGGAAPGDEGTVVVLGLSHSIELGAATISFPFNLAYFITDEYHAVGSDDGFGFASLGVAASLPLTTLIGDAYGDWSLNAGLTYYVTDSGVTPNNPKNDFLTASLGLALAF
jgi:hypothetical protein